MLRMRRWDRDSRRCNLRRDCKLPRLRNGLRSRDSGEWWD